MQMFQNLHRTLAPSQTLKARCVCGHEQRWTRPQAVLAFGSDAAPFEIRRRLRCLSCGERGKANVWI